jgi:hypothetical protein
MIETLTNAVARAYLPFVVEDVHAVLEEPLGQRTDSRLVL